MPEESVNTAAQEYYCRLTNAGAVLEASAKTSAKPVVLTHVAVGDGNGEVPAPAASAMALVNEVYRRQIDGRERDKEDPNIAWLHIIIPADVGGFWIREFGIYAQPLEEGGEPVLYAYGNHAPYYKQQTAQGQATTHELSIPIILSGTAEVEISVKDAGYASQLALDDLRQSLLENDGEGPRVLDTILPLATQDAPGAVRPDGATLTVDEAGLLQALGGNLLLNSELWITESGTFEAPVDGWYSVLCIDGGSGGLYNIPFSGLSGGPSGAVYAGMVYLKEGESVEITIGAGGLGATSAQGYGISNGGETRFGDHELACIQARIKGHYTPSYGASLPSGFNYIYAVGGGPGAGGPIQWGSDDTQQSVNAKNDASFFGGGGGATLSDNKQYAVGAGKQGVVLMRWHDPAKAAGPLPEPALLSARRAAAPRTTAQPATVNLYDPATGQGSVWREEDAEAKLAEGLISEEAWLAICEAKAAEERAAWLADPETAAERFEMLRAARDVKLAATDYLVAPDYPLTDDARAAVTAYRQSLRDLPAQPGAPWDGGGELTPWPKMPEL